MTEHFTKLITSRINGANQTVSSHSYKQNSSNKSIKQGPPELPPRNNDLDSDEDEYDDLQKASEIEYLNSFKNGDIQKSRDY